MAEHIRIHLDAVKITYNLVKALSGAALEELDVFKEFVEFLKQREYTIDTEDFARDCITDAELVLEFLEKYLKKKLEQS